MLERFLPDLDSGAKHFWRGGYHHGGVRQRADHFRWHDQDYNGSRDRSARCMKAGVWFPSMLDTINFAPPARGDDKGLQQVAGRSSKVDVKPFAIHELPRRRRCRRDWRPKP